MGKVDSTTGCSQIQLGSKADMDLEAGEGTNNPDPFDSIWNPLRMPFKRSFYFSLSLLLFLAVLFLYSEYYSILFSDVPLGN